MFRVITLDRLSVSESEDAIKKPINEIQCPVKFDSVSIGLIIENTAGYSYFIQFICREVYDIFLQKLVNGDTELSVPIQEIITKLDTDFFAGRWMRATDRQRELLTVIARLENCEDEFTVHEIVAKTQESLKKPISSSQVSQMLSALIDAGLIHKSRHGRYSFAVPLMGRYIKRQQSFHFEPILFS